MRPIAKVRLIAWLMLIIGALAMLGGTNLELMPRQQLADALLDLEAL